MEKKKEMYFEPFRYHERILNNRSVKYESKMEALLEIWRKLQKLGAGTEKNIAAEILNWVKLHTLNIVLSAEWNSFKNEYEKVLIEEIEKGKVTILHYGKGIQAAVKRLIEVVNSPWGNPTLTNIINSNNRSILSEQIEFFYTETAYLISIRLKKLCESHCEDLALNLATVFMDCCASTKDNFYGTNDQKWYIFDVFIALLHKFHGNNEITAKLRKLPLQEGLQCAKRFANKRIKYLKLWENSREIAIVASQLYISQIMNHYNTSLKSTLNGFIQLYKSICSTKYLLEKFSESMDRISNLADSTELEDLCDTLRLNYDSALKPLVLKIYVKILTADMNVKEEQEVIRDTKMVEKTNAKIARILTSLAEFFEEHVKVTRECLLTAFSLCPTEDRLKQIENLAKCSGLVVSEVNMNKKCGNQPLNNDDTCSSEWLGQLKLDWSKTNMALNEAMQYSALGIPETLCDDLLVCISSPRNKIFHWLLPWNDLHRLCVMHLNNPQATKIAVKELKYVKIDYSAFKDMKREPINYFEGIENGYEHYIYADFGIKVPKHHVSSKKGKSSENSDTEINEVIMASKGRVNLKRLHFTAESELWENKNM